MKNSGKPEGSFWKQLVRSWGLMRFWAESLRCSLREYLVSVKQSEMLSAAIGQHCQKNQLTLEELQEARRLLDSNEPMQLIAYSAGKNRQGAPSPATSLGFAREPEAAMEHRAVTGLIYEDQPRYHAIMSAKVGESDFTYWDPRADMPLDDQVEKAIDQMGPALYLRWLCQEYRVDVHPIPESEHQARRAARIAVRSLRDYPGERFIQ